SGTIRVDRGFAQTAGEIVLNGGSFGGGSNLAITLAGGTLRGNGSVNVHELINTGAIVSPGLSAGIPGDVHGTGGNNTQGASGTLHIELGGTAAGTQYDQ